MIYPEAQLRAQSALGAGESLVWNSVPNARRAAVAAISETITPAIALFGFALLWTIQAYSVAVSTSTASTQTSSPVRSALIIPLVFLVGGLLNLARPLWVYRRALRTVYAITSHRVMIIRGEGRSSVDSLDPAEVCDLKSRERQDGSGDVMISTDFSVRTRNSLARRRWWFYGVPNAKAVAQLISEVKHRRDQALSRAGRFVPLDFNSPV